MASGMTGISGNAGVRVAWFALLAAALALYVNVVVPANARARAAIDAAREYVALAARNERLLARLPRSGAARIVLASEVQRLAPTLSRAEATLRLLRSIARLGRDAGVDVAAVTPGAAASASAPGAVPLQIELEGPYANVLRATSGLSLGDVPLEVAACELSPAGSEGSRNRIRARVSATLFYDGSAIGREEEAHRASTDE